MKNGSQPDELDYKKIPSQKFFSKPLSPTRLEPLNTNDSLEILRELTVQKFEATYSSNCSHRLLRQCLLRETFFSSASLIYDVIDTDNDFGSDCNV